MITIKLPFDASEDDIAQIMELQKSHAAVYHCAYNLWNSGLDQNGVRAELKQRSFDPRMDSWFVQSAVNRAQGQVKADKELGVINRIFGGKKLFQRRSKGLISREQYQELKLEPIYLVGESQPKGNRKFTFASDAIIFKPNRGTKIEIQLPELRGKYLKYYNALLDKMYDDPQPITVQLDQNFIYLTFDETKLKTTQPKSKPVIKGRYLGIDLNPNNIGVSFYDQNKQLLETRLYDLSQLTGKNYNADKLKHEVREIALEINRLANHYRIEYRFVEELSFKQGDKNKGKRFNRLTINQFLYTEFKRMLAKQGKVLEVNAAYSSTIGNIMHPDQPDPIAASMEIARRGIESRIVKGGGQFFPPIVNNEFLLNRWKEAAEWSYLTWKELHQILKETGLKYRVSLPSREMFRLFASKRSNVFVYTNL
jgi:hypothetical protein